MVIATAQNPLYAFNYVGNPGNTDAAKAKTLSEAGPLDIAKESLWAKLLPDAFEIRHPSGTPITYMTGWSR